MKEIMQQHLRRSYADEHLPKTVLAEARSLNAQAKYDAALEKYLWFHRHALEYNEAFAGVRLSFALDEWVNLGEKYPPAREALLAVRDGAIEAFENGKGSVTLFMDVAAINQSLQDEGRTAQLFKVLHQAQPELARQCYAVAEGALVESGEYETCISYLVDLERRLETIRQSYHLMLGIAQEHFILSSPQARVNEYANLKLLEDTTRLIAILEGVGHMQDADRVREFLREQGKK